MSFCMICQKSLGFFDSKKCLDGVICSACAAKIPKFISTKELSAEDIAAVSDRFEELEKLNFEETVRYGKLHVDESKGLFYVDVSEKDRQKFLCIDLEEISIHCTNPANKSNQVYCDVELRCIFQYPVYYTWKVLIAKNIKCHSKRQGTQLAWEEPGDFLLFRSIFQHMLQATTERYSKEQETMISKYGMEIFKAKTLFLLDPDEEFTVKELKNRRNQLIKAFHPDQGGSTEDGQKINEAFRLLKKLAKEEAE